MTMVRVIALLGCGLVGLFWSELPVFAQAFTSGSTGSLGAFSPATNTVVTLPADGILNYTTVTIPVGVTVTFQPNAANTPVIMLATGNVLIAGVVNLDGVAGTGYGVNVPPGGAGGPGGFRGGQGGAKGAINNAPSGGQGPGGGATSASYGGGGFYGAPTSFVSLVPLFGGSGGGGYPGTTGQAGIAGGGGGGAIVIGSSTKITLTGTIFARGGDGGPTGIIYAGGGSGGAIRLVSPEIAGNGTINVLYGQGGNPQPGLGRARLEAFRMNFTGNIYPSNSIFTVTTTCGPITSNSVPALSNLPTLRISAIAGVSTPSTTGGTYSTADVTLPGGTTNPVSVTVTGTNLPVGSTFTLKHIPQFAAAAAPLTAASTGTFATSTATFSVTLPVGQVSVLNAWSDFTLP
ncbi:MAG: hypothetical protein V9G17_06285 [Nitrospira sp.]|jgi:hypothetical protein|nr:hypothetical protein [Nitrospira sp.]HQY58228.1 hypothetical protein [Nitrospira sp.]HRA95617.1 hypothetical protein [Nitrospira sp.]